MMKRPQNRQQAAARLKKLKRVFLLSLLCTVVLFGLMATAASAADDFSINVNAGDTAGNLGALEVIVIFAFLALLPSFFLMMTSFTRIIIVLGFLRSAMGTNQSPPNMVLIGLSIFLTLFIMMPTLGQMNEEAFEPYLAGEMDAMEALTAATGPVKRFMVSQMDTQSLDMFLDLSGTEPPVVADAANPVEIFDLPLTVLAPAFITSELSRAFLMGFLIFLPFLIIDMVVSSILMSMGMVMLPPAMIALPFKILLFVLVDGWNMMMGTLVNSFGGPV